MEKFTKGESVTINPHRVKRNPEFDGTFKIVDVPFNKARKCFRKIYNLMSENGKVLTLSQRNLVKL